MAVSITTETKFYDGKTSIAHKVSVALSGSILYVESRATKEQIAAWPLNTLYVHENRAPPQPGILSCSQNTDARLYINNEKGWKYILYRLPKSAHKGRQMPIHWSSFFGYGIVAIASLIFIFTVLPGILGSLAHLMPLKWQEELGRNAISSMVGADKTCIAPDGLRVLDMLTTRIERQFTRKIEYKVRVIRNPRTYNAFAAPGGYIIIYENVIRKARSPEEFAGVLAHEMAHVDLHHATKSVVTGLGLGAILSLAMGGTGSIESLANFLNQMNYSRKHEGEADLHAKKALLAADINPIGLQDFLNRVRAMEESIGLDFEGSEYLEYFSSHPDTSKRIEALNPAKEQEKSRTFARALTEQDWKALRNICSKTEKTNYKKTNP